MPRVVFAGLRKDFLTAQLEDYEKALTDGARDDFVNDVLRRFLKRFPLDLPLDKEPSQEHLNAVNDSAPDEEPVLPEALPSGEAEPLYNAAMEKYEAEVSLIETRRAVSVNSEPYLITVDSVPFSSLPLACDAAITGTMHRHT